MKRILSFILIIILLVTGGVSVFAYREITADELLTMDGPVAGLTPETAIIQHCSVTFYISAGRANASYYISAKCKDIEVNVLVEKRTLGVFWTDVGKKTEKSNNSYYFSGAYSVDIAGSGEYRVTVEFNASGEKLKKTVYFKYDESIFLGDVNGDNRINASDARLILRCAARLEQFTAIQKSYADIDADGKITAADARIALKMSAKL